MNDSTLRKHVRRALSIRPRLHDIPGKSTPRTQQMEHRGTDLIGRIELLEARKATPKKRDLRAITKHIKADLESQPGVKVLWVGVTRPKRTSKRWQDAVKLAHDGSPAIGSYPGTVMKKEFPEAYTNNYEVVALYVKTKAPPKPAAAKTTRRRKRSPKEEFLSEVGIEAGASRAQQAEIERRVRAAAFFKNKKCWSLVSGALVLKFSGTGKSTVKKKLVPLVFKGGHKPCVLSGENIALDLVQLDDAGSTWLLVLHGRRGTDVDMWEDALRANGIFARVNAVVW